MEEIEYLEEYEDLVLPAINSAAGAAVTAKSKPVNVDNDGSSSSLDQDIFNCLFDDNSDDDNDEQQQPFLKEQEIFNQNITLIGEQVSRECSLEKHTISNKGKDSSKATKQISSLTSAKTKTVTTVRPTVQQKTQLQKYNTTKQKTRHSNTTAPNANLKAATSTLNPSTTSSARHYSVANTSSFTPTSSSSTNKLNTSHRPKPSFNKPRPATIVKPEKIVTKDPAEDPLNLDDLSSAESANYSVSDISGETYNSISDFDDDDDYDFSSHIDALDDDDDESSNSKVIDISNDSSESRSHFEDLRGSTPSPVVSEDRDLPTTSALIKRSSLPKFMANHEIIKSLLTKGEKPKLLQLINEHDKTVNLGNRGQELENLELSSTPETTKKDLTVITEPSLLSAHINEENDQDGESKTLSDIQSPESILHDTHLKDIDENNGKSDIDVVKTSKHDSLPNQEVGAEMEIGNEELIEEALNRGDENIKDSRTLEQTTITQSSKLEKKSQSTKVETKGLDTDKIREKVETPITKEVRNDKESTSPRPRKKRFRNIITPELLGLKEDKSIEIISDTKCNEPSIQLDSAGITNNQEGSNYVLKNSTVLSVDCKTKMKAEQNVTTTKFTSKEPFKSPTKGVDKSNKNSSNRDRSCDKSTDSSRDTLNKHIKDVPRGVIMNPFVQRTTKNTFSKDGRAKMSRESSRDNSRESSVESSRSSSRDRYEDNVKTCKLLRSEISTNTQHDSTLKDLREEIIKKTDAAENPVSVDTKKRESPKRSNDIVERKYENKMKTNDKDICKSKSVAIKDTEHDAKNTTHLADTKKKETTKKSIDIEEGKSDIKKTANDNDINKAIGHVTKDITGSTIKRKGTTEKIFTDKPLKPNEGNPEIKQSSSPFKNYKEQLKSDTECDLPSKSDNICRENFKADTSKGQKLTSLQSTIGIAKMSKDITDPSGLLEKSNEQKDLKEKSQHSQSYPAGSLGSNKKSLTTNKEASVDVSEISSDSINSAVEKDVRANKINKPSIMQSNTSSTTGTSELKVLGGEKKNIIKESKTAIRSKETSKSLNKDQQESPSHSQDYRHIQSKQKLAIASPDKVLNSPNSGNESRAEGKSVISKTSVNTANILKSERRVEEVNTECDGKKKSHVATDINPQKKASKSNEEKKHVRSSKDKLAIALPGKVLNNPNSGNESRAEGKSVISKTSANTANILESEARVEEVNTECDGKKKSHVVTDINPQKKVSKPNEEKKHVRASKEKLAIAFPDKVLDSPNSINESIADGNTVISKASVKTANILESERKVEEVNTQCDGKKKSHVATDINPQKKDSKPNEEKKHVRASKEKLAIAFPDKVLDSPNSINESRAEGKSVISKASVKTANIPKSERRVDEVNTECEGKKKSHVATDINPQKKDSKPNEEKKHVRLSKEKLAIAFPDKVLDSPNSINESRAEGKSVISKASVKTANILESERKLEEVNTECDGKKKSHVATDINPQKKDSKPNEEKKHVRASKEKLAIAFPDKVLDGPNSINESRAEGKSLISKASVKTANILESEKRVEEKNTECEGKKKSHVATDINPQKKDSKPNEEKKLVRAVSTSFGKKSSKDMSIKSVTSSFDSVKTANILESEKRAEEKNTECEGKKKSHVATDINPQKKDSKPNEEKKLVRAVSTSFGKKSSKDMSIKSVTSSFDSSKGKECTTSVRRDVLKLAIEKVDPEGNSSKVSQSSMDKSTDDARQKDSGNTKIKTSSEQTTKSKKTEKPYSKVEKCELLEEENNEVNTEVIEPDNNSKVSKGADQESISIEIKSSAISDNARSKDDNSTSIINCDELNTQNPKDFISTISDLESNLHSKEKESSLKDSKLSKIEDAEKISLNEQDPMTSKTLTETTVGLIEPRKGKNYKNDDVNITKSKGEVSEKKDIDVQQVEIDTNEFKSKRNTSVICSNLRTIESNSKDTTNVILKNYRYMETHSETDSCKKPEIKKDIKDVCRSEEESATAEITSRGATCIESKDERQQKTNDTGIEEVIRNEATSAETNATVEENINTVPAEGSTLQITGGIDVNTLPKSSAINSRKTRSSKPGESLIQEETNVACNPLKAAGTKDVEIKNTYVDTPRSKNAKSEETDLSNKDHLEISNIILEESKETHVKADKICEIKPAEIDKSSDQSAAIPLKSVMRKTRSTANTVDVPTHESNSMDDTKLHLSNNPKINDNTIKTSQRNIRKNRSTPSKCEDLEEDSKPQELIVSICEKVSLDELTQFEAIKDNDENDANKLEQKNNRKTRYSLDPKADNTNKIRIGDYDTPAFNANKDESPKSKPKLVKKSDPIMLGFDSDKTAEPNIEETSNIKVTCIRHENPKTTDDGHKSTDSVSNLPAKIIAKDCINEPTSKRNQHFKDDGNKTECESILNLEPPSAIEEISKNTDTLTPGYSTGDTSFAGKNTRDLLINDVKSTNVPTKTDLQKHSDNQVEPTINTNLKTSVAKTTSKESLEILTLSKCFSDAEADLSKEATCYSAERARTLRKRGTASPFCENRDGANKSLFKTPISVFESCKVEAPSAPEFKMKRRLRSPAAEKELHTPISKKSKTDIRKARNRNIDVGIVDSSESLSDVIADQFPSTSKETRVLSPRRSLQKLSAPINETLSDSTTQAHDIKSNMAKPCELEETARATLREDRRSAEKTNLLTRNLNDVDTSSCVYSQCTKGKSNTDFSKGLSDTKEKKQYPGMSKTCPDKELFYPEKRASSSILSFAEWLRGNNRNDASQIQNQSIANTTSIPPELSGTSKPIGLQEFILKNPIETVPEQATKLSSHISRQVSPKRGRKVKSIPTSREADNKESVQSVENNSEITKEKNSFQLHNIPRELVVATAIEDVPEQITKPITKKLSQTPPKADTSPKRGRKVKTMSIMQTETASDDVATEKRESHIAAPTNVKDTKLKICMKSEQNTTSPQEKKTTQQQNSSLTGESIGAEKIRDINDNDNLSVSISSPSLKSGRRRPKIRSSRILVTGTVNKDQQKLKSMHPTRQDKKTNKRTEIDILIESMSKEMKDAGINDLLNNSSNVKRQRAVVKRAESTYLNPAVLVTNETVAKEKIIKDASSIIESAGSSNTVEDISKTSPTRRSLSKKLNITKESNKNVMNNESLRPMEMEKALIDEAEIRNMNTSLLEPLKSEPTKQHRPLSKLAVKATPSPQNSDFKTPKPLTTINRIKSAEDVSQLYRGNDHTNLSDSVRRVSSLKCRMLKIRLNRRAVKKYLQNLRQVDISNTSLINRTEPTQKASSATVVAQLPAEKEVSNVTEAQVLRRTNKDPGEAYKKQQSLNTHKTIPTTALLDERDHIIYPTPNNMTRSNSRNVEEILPDSVMEPMVPIELKNEFLDENPNSLGDTTLPDTPTLIARSHTITRAAASALSNTIMPTDIRLLSNDPMSTRSYVPSFGVTPTLVDAKGARMYTFLHPAKYSRNHGNVLLDYCCPNLDGPMPAIDPTRIHAQVQTPVIELPSCIVLTTKVVTRAELESKSSTIPAVIRKKAEKLRSNIHQNLGAPHETAINAVPSLSPRPLQLHSQQITNSTHPQELNSVMKPSHISTAPDFSPAINALAKYLPSTTTITAKIRPPTSQPHLTLPVPNTNQHASSVVSVSTKASPILSETQSNLLRSNLRRVDVLFKSLVQPFEKLNFTERHRIIDSLGASGKFLPKDLERTIVLMEEYLKQINEFQRNQITDASSSSNIVNAIPTQLANLAPTRMPPLQPAPKLASSSTFKVDTDQNLEQVHNTAIRKVQSTVKQHNTTVNTTTIKQRQVPIYDTERNIIGYQLQVITPATTMPAYTKSSLSNASGGIMSSSLGASSNQRKSLKRPAQDSPRVFYTSQPMQTSTPKANLKSMQYSTTPMTVNQNAQTIGKSQNGSIVTTVRSAGATSAGTETITTTTMATVKRVTRSRAAGSKILIVSKSNSNEETILPDVNHQTEIKHEKDVEDFMG